MSKRKNSNRKRIPLRDRDRSSRSNSSTPMVETTEMKEQNKKFWMIVAGITLIVLILLYVSYSKFVS